MNAQLSFEQAWREYQGAVRQMYNTPADTLRGEAERGDRPPDALQAAAAAPSIASSSEAVRVVLENSLTSDNTDEREMASLKLLAAAAHDMAVASDLMQIEQAGPGAEPERSGQSVAAGVQDLRDVLEAPLQAPPEMLQGVDRGSPPADLAGAKAALKTAITGLLREAPQNAADTSQTAAIELGSIGLGPVRSAASLAADAILEKVGPETRPASRKAAEIVVEAIAKIRSAIGKETEDQVIKQAADWAEDFKKDRGFVSTLLDKLYETERIGADAMDALDKVPASTSAGALNTASESIRGLGDMSEKTRKTLAAVIKVMAFVKVPLIGAAPWGPLAVCTAYLGLLGYSVYLNGDILDWQRTGSIAWLNRVPGLRSAIDAALKDAPPAPQTETGAPAAG